MSTIEGSAKIRPHDGLGCSLDHLSRSASLVAKAGVVYRKTSLSTERRRVETPASDRGTLIGIALAPGHKRRILRNHQWQTHAFAQGDIYIRDFREDYTADIATAFDFLLVELPKGPSSGGHGAAMEDGMVALSETHGVADPVISHLAQALLPALEAPQESCPLFVDQVLLTMRMHLVHRYGYQPGARGRRPQRLSLQQEKRAKDLLLRSLSGDVLIADIAAACALSRSYFIRAFCETTGSTPYQWLLDQRVKQAQLLLRSTDLPLAEVAVSCGFADQSHLTRIFTRRLGITPAAWRRQQ